MPGADQLVVQVVERALVAGDDLGAEDHRVAGSSRTRGCWPAATRVRALRASPWLPVQR